MAVEKIYEPYEHIQHTSIPKEQPKTQTETKTVTKKVVVQLTRFEKFLYITLVTAIAVLKNSYAIFKNGCVRYK